VLAEVEGFNPELIAGEEPEMCQRIRANGHIILHIDQPMTQHDLAITRWSQYWRRAVRAGHAYAEISNQFKNLWQRDAKRNWVHASILSGIFAMGGLLSITLGSGLPLCGSFLLFLLLGLRTAWKARWKSNNRWTLLLYGLHSHFQQIPIAIGQLSYYYHRWRGQRRRLIEYK